MDVDVTAVLRLLANTVPQKKTRNSWC